MTIHHKPENTTKTNEARPSLGKALHPNHRAALIAAISELSKATGSAQLKGIYIDRDQRENCHDAITAIYDNQLSDAEKLIWSLAAALIEKDEPLSQFAFSISRLIGDARVPGSFVI